MFKQLQRLLVQSYVNSQSLLARSPCACVLSQQISSSTCHMAAQPTVTPDNILQSHIPDIKIPTNVPFHQYLFEKCDLFKDQTAVVSILSSKSFPAMTICVWEL
ncbi:4-coumarate--CoA ligase [Biomphalaria glabrata]|nr:4-coumarate--CoA ligase-like [Biomphalaria glabrata]KAI8788278.1 4-coumarate--CoA ligase [Biomphalaria glabrata]